MGRQMRQRMMPLSSRLNMKVLLPTLVLALAFQVATSAQTPSIAIYQPTGVQRTNTTIPYVISDAEGSPVSLLAEYSTNDGSTWLAAAVSGDTSGIASADYDSSLIWQSLNNLADQDVERVWFRITPYDLSGWGTADTTYIDIDNQAPQWVEAEGTSGDSTFTFWFDELVADSTATDTSNISLSGGLTAGSITGIGHDVWSTKASISFARQAPEVVVIDGKLYMAGGYDDGYLSTLEVYNPATDSWTTKASMPTSRWVAQAGVIDGLLYVAGGGDDAGYSTALEVYDPSSDTWTTRTSMPFGVSVGVAGVIDGKLYVASVEGMCMYDPSTDAWQTKASKTGFRSGRAGGVIDGKLYIVADSGSESQLDIYDPSTDNWTTGPSAPTPRQRATAGVIAGKLYVTGGDNGTQSVNTLEVYDPSTNEWTTGTSIPTTNRTFPAAGVIDNELYVVAGGVQLTVEVYTALPSRFELTLSSGQKLSSAEPSIALTATGITDLNGNVAASLDTTFTPADPNRPSIALRQPSGTQIGDVTLPYVISDPEGGPVGLLAEYSTDSGSTWLAATITGDTIDIALADFDSSLVWHSVTDLDDQEVTGVRFRTTPYDQGGWGTASITHIDIDNLAPQWIEAEGTSGDSTLMFWFDELVADSTATDTSNISLSGGLTAGSITGSDHDVWSTKASMSGARARASAGVIDGKLYIAGGGSDPTLSILEVYDPVTDSWTTKTPMPTARWHAGAGVIDGKLYVAGGFFSTLEVYDPSTDTWMTKASMSTANDCTEAAVIDGKLYVTDGWKLEVYDPSTDSWTAKTPIPSGRNRTVTGVIDGKLYVAGGGFPTAVNTLEVYDPETDSWTTRAPMLFARTHAAGGVIDGKLYVAGGNDESNRLTTLEVYDPSTDSWTTKTSMPSDRNFAAAGVIDNKLYVAGGSSTNLEVYTALASRFELTLSGGQKLSSAEPPVTLTATSITDLNGNMAASLDTTFAPADPNRPNIGVYQPTGTQIGDVTLPYVISDPEGSSVGLLAEYSTDTGTTWLAASITGDTSGIALADFDSSMVWHSGTDLEDQEVTGVRFRITPHDPGGWGTASITHIDIDNLVPQWIVAEGTSGDSTFAFWFSEHVSYTSATNTGNFTLTGGLTVGNIIGSDHDAWTTKASMLTARRYAAAGVINGKLYVVGGWDDYGAIDLLEVYDPSMNSWTAKTSMPNARALAAAGVIDGKLYVAGGRYGNPLTTLEVYDPLTESWTTKTSMSTARFGTVAGVIDGKLYVVGGNDWGTPSGTLEVYDPSTDNWTTKASMPTARLGAVAGVIDGKLYVAGGDNEGDLATLEVYDPSTNSWTPKTSMLTARTDAAAVVIDGKLYVSGGSISGGTLNTMEVYDPSIGPNGAWTTKAYMSTPRMQTSAQTIDGKLYVVGGSTGSGGVRGTLEVYTAIPSRFELTLVSGQILSSAEPPVTLTATNIMDLNSNVADSLDTTLTPVDLNRPTIALWQPAGTQSSDVTVPYTISDPEGSSTGLLAEYSLNSGSTWQKASVSPDTSGIALADYDSSLVWQSGSDLANQVIDQIWFRVTPHDPGGWGTADITFIDIDNVAPQWVAASGVGGETTLTFWFDELVDEDTATNTSNLFLSGGLTAGSIIGRGHDEWATKTPMPTGRWKPVSGVIDGKLYVVGGLGDGFINLNILEVYDPASDSWETKTPMPTARAGAAAGVIDGKLYVVGGSNDSGGLSTLEVYDPITNSWTTKISMPDANSEIIAGVIDGKLYVTGGGGAQSRLHVYDPSSGSWTTKTSMLSYRGAPAAGVIDGKFYVAGGWGNGFIKLSILEVYDPATESWTSKASMPVATSGAGAGVIDGKLYIAGGDDDVDGYTTRLVVYDPATDNWTTETSMNFRHAGLTAGVIDNKLYVTGGIIAEVFLNTLQEYTALPPQFELTLTNGQTLPTSDVTITASNIADFYGNTIAAPLNSSFTPADPTRPEIAVYQPTGIQRGDVTIPFVINDPEGSPISLLAEYWIDDGAGWRVASVTGDTSDIAPANFSGSLTWLSGTDFSNQEFDGIWFRITPRDPWGTGTADNTLINIDNIAPSSLTMTGSVGSAGLRFQFNEPVTESSATNISNYSFNGSITGSLNPDNIRAIEEWSDEIIELQSDRYAASIAFMDDKVFIIGGTDGTDDFDNVDVYDFATGSWSTSTPLPAPRREIETVVLDGKLYCIGGMSSSGDYYQNIDVFDPATGFWTTVTMPFRMDNARGEAAVIDGKIYITNPYEGMNVYDPQNQSWQNVGMVYGNTGAASGVLDGKLYIAGGWNDSAQNEDNSLVVFDPVALTTAPLTPMPTARNAATMSVLGGKLYVAGRHPDGSVAGLEIYDPVTNTWSIGQSAPEIRNGYSSFVRDGKFYYGGAHHSGVIYYRAYHRNTYELTLGLGETLPHDRITVQASNIEDWAGNVSGTISEQFIPDDNNANPGITVNDISGEVSAGAIISYVITDAESDTIRLVPEFSTDTGTTWKSATTSADTLDIDSGNYTGTITWFSGTDLDGIDLEGVLFRLTPADNVVELGQSDSISLHVDNNQVPTATITNYAYTGTDTTWTIDYLLSDAEADTLALIAEYSIDSGGTWNSASFYGSTLIASDAYSGSLQWRSGRDLPGYTGAVQFRITPSDIDQGSSDTVEVLVWLSDIPGILCSTAAGEQSGNVTIDFQISDVDESIIGLLVEYFSPAEIWEMAAITSSTDTTALGAQDYVGSFTWDSAADLAGMDIDSAMVRITPHDNGVGQADTLKIHIDNNAVPGLIGGNTSGTARDITLNFTLTDTENDTLRLWGYYSIDSRATWHLMTLVEDLSEIPPGQYPSNATWRSFDDIGYANHDSVFVNLYAADHDTVGPLATDAIADFVNYVGDYSGDTSIDFTDFATLTSAWNDQNTYHDIGPATGTVPDLVPTPDGKIDFEDLAVFSIMWNSLANGQASLLIGEQAVGYVRSGSRTPSMDVDEHPVVVQSGEPDDVWQQDDGVVTWSIEAREIAGLSAAHLILQYDPAQLHFLDLEPGSFLGVVNGREQSLIHLKRVDPQTGILELMLGRIDTEDPDVDGSGILAVARFREIVTAEHSFTIAYDLRDRSTDVLASGRYDARVASTRLPGEFALLQNYPNPFNGQTTIRFQLPSRQKVSLYLFNVRGQLVRTLLDEEMEPGYHKVTWDGRTENGQTVASGIYIYLIQAGRNRQSLKLTIIK